MQIVASKALFSFIVEIVDDSASLTGRCSFRILTKTDNAGKEGAFKTFLRTIVVWLKH